PFLGSDFSMSATFSNTGTTVGYGPYVDVILPVPGADGPPQNDGISFISGSARYLGAPVTTFVTTFDAQGQARHPLAKDNTGQPVIVAGPAGDQLVVFQLPFGSFTPGQPSATITFSAHFSSLANVGTPLDVGTEAGFWLGADPLDDPTIDPSFLGARTTKSVTSTVVQLTKRYLGPEHETVTGPNFREQYLVSLVVAPGQTLGNVDLIDNLPSNMQFVSVNAVSGNGATLITPISKPSTTAP